MIPSIALGAFLIGYGIRGFRDRYFVNMALIIIGALSISNDRMRRELEAAKETADVE